ncbi:unnamed protein product [Agarophyton chilense]
MATSRSESQSSDQTSPPRSRSPSPPSNSAADADADADVDADASNTAHTQLQLLLLGESISAAIEHQRRFSSPPPSPSLPVLYERRRALAARVQHFWLTVMLSHPALTLLVSAADTRVLRRLEHVHVAERAATPTSFELSFFFAPECDAHTFCATRTTDSPLACVTKRYAYSERCGRVFASGRVVPPSSDP